MIAAQQSKQVGAQARKIPVFTSFCEVRALRDCFNILVAKLALDEPSL
jgi:hypothetical protein